VALTVMILTIVAAVAFCQLVRDGLDLQDGAEHLDAHPAADHVRAALVVGRP
jgi:hypothetical protein